MIIQSLFPNDRYSILKDEINYSLELAKGRYFVYMLMHNNEIAYIGRTRNLCQRLYIHKFAKEFSVVKLYEFETYEQSKIAEKVMIHFFMPTLNKHLKSQK